MARIGFRRVQVARKTVAGLLVSILLLSGIAVNAQDAGTDAPATVAKANQAAEDDAASRQQFRSLDENVQDLKKEVLDLNRDLYLLEEDLLFPANSEVAFFVALDVGEYFDLDSINLKIDGKEVANYLYTKREVGALERGGVQRLHMANLKTGDHELIAVFTGKGPHDRDYRRGATMTFNKGIGAKYVELKITDREKKEQPEFAIKEWE
jgi:cell division protein FtsB